MLWSISVGRYLRMMVNQDGIDRKVARRDECRQITIGVLRRVCVHLTRVSVALDATRSRPGHKMKHQLAGAISRSRLGRKMNHQLIGARNSATIHLFLVLMMPLTTSTKRLDGVRSTHQLFWPRSQSLEATPGKLSKRMA